MRSMFFAISIALFALSNVAFAQSYSVRVAFNTNLRATYSLQGNIVETAPAGSILQVIGEFNRWLKINRNGNEVWMANWVRHSRVESSEATQTSEQPASDIDNCCFVDRQCNSDQEWTDGYWDYQNGQCAAPTQSQPQTSAQPASNVDNCCFVDRQCNSDQEWTEGYWAYQNGQCSTPSQTLPSAQVDNCCNTGWQCGSDPDREAGHNASQTNQCIAPAVQFAGSPGFVAHYRKAFELLRTRAPQWYWYAVSGLDKIIQDRSRNSVGVLLHERGVVSHYGDELPATGDPHIGWLARQLVHEACHVHMWEAGIWYDEGWRNELPCHEVDLQALQRVDPNSRYIPYILTIIDNYRNHRTWWGPGEWRG